MARPGQVRTAGTDLDAARTAGTCDGGGAADLAGSRHAGLARSCGHGCARAGSVSIAAHRSFRRLTRAAFAVALTLPDLSTLPAGTHEAPENAATLILQVRWLGPRPQLSAGRTWVARAGAAVGGRPARRDFGSAWQQNHALFPRGVDIVLCAGTSLAALPRSVDAAGDLNHGLCRGQRRRTGDRSGACLAGRGAARRPDGAGVIAGCRSTSSLAGRWIARWAKVRCTTGNWRRWR